MIGERLRGIRRSRNLTLQQIAQGAGLSKSFISQIEAGVVNPSIESLGRITEFLAISPSDLLDSAGGSNGLTASPPSPVETTPITSPVAIVRKNQRKGLVWPDSPRETHLLTPDLQHRTEVLLTTYEPGTGAEDAWTQHVGEEFGFVLDGRVEFLIGDDVHELNEGDSIYFDATLPHKVRPVADVPGTVIMVLTPPWF